MDSVDREQIDAHIRNLEKQEKVDRLMNKIAMLIVIVAAIFAIHRGTINRFQEIVNSLPKDQRSMVVAKVDIKSPSWKTMGSLDAFDDARANLEYAQKAMKRGDTATALNEIINAKGEIEFAEKNGANKLLDLRPIKLQVLQVEKELGNLIKAIKSVK